MSDHPHPRGVLEESGIQWKRDWDALFVGFVVGVLVAVVIAVVIWGGVP